MEKLKQTPIWVCCNLFVSEEDLNSDEDIINFQNGLLRLSDMTLLPHTPDQLSTIQLPCDWPPAPSETPVYNLSLIHI